MERLDKIQEIRDLLTFLDDHPEVPLPYWDSVHAFTDTDEADLDTVARAMAPCQKSVDSNYFAFERKFGSLEFSVNFAREEVCERVVVGTEQVPAHTVAAYTKEIVEWNCPDGVLRQA